MCPRAAENPHATKYYDMQLITITMEVGEFKKLLADSIKEELLKLSISPGQVPDRILSRKQTAHKIDRHLSTLWRIRHVLKPRKRKADGAIYYLESEVDQYLELNKIHS